ncbi:MAG: hypothetical protein EBV03_14115 [Proteobacteria bacterium]|nr:hypothetical protein [Pseudomonadota bacterium]
MEKKITQILKLYWYVDIIKFTIPQLFVMYLMTNNYKNFAKKFEEMHGYKIRVNYYILGFALLLVQKISIVQILRYAEKNIFIE